MNLKEGATLRGGKYKIIRKLGSGTFGITYLASGRFDVQGPLGGMEVTANIAIKEFFMKDLNTRGNDGHSVGGSSTSVCADYRKRFRKEAENLSTMNHPNIVKVLDVFDENDTSYYAMEFIVGEDMDSYVKRNHPLKEEEAVGIITTVGNALQYMHQQHFLHLDLKPNNIMRTPNGVAKLIDFGLSKHFNESGSPETSTSIGLGTPGYAPIEQANYKPSGTFPATIDIYALGATFYKILTGVRPPEASEVLNDGLPLEPLKSTNRSQKIIDAITTAMEPMKRNRCQSVRDFLNILDFKISQVDNTELTVVSVETTGCTESTELHRKDVSHIGTPYGEINGHVYVDLGLPSGLKWATCNIGANLPEEYGDYFAWGETTGKDSYNSSNNRTRNKDVSTLQSEGIINSAGNLARDYDAASAKWGVPWRMPTKAEFDELVSKCKWTWDTQNGKTSYKVTGPNKKSIFLPAAGGRYGTSLYSADTCGDYWSSTVNSGVGYAYRLYFTHSNHYTGWYYRSNGRSARPVSD